MSIDRLKCIPKTRRQQSVRRRLGLTALLLLGAAFVPSAGCTALTGINSSWQYNGYWNNGMMFMRNGSLAMKAWHSRKHCFANQQHLKDFHRGFKAGYMQVADGGDGCTPAFPPREYWGWKYQSHEGQARVAAWFSGFPHGARAAEEDGIGNWYQIQTSSNIQKQYSEHGLLPSEYNGISPVPSFDLQRSGNSNQAPGVGAAAPIPMNGQAYPNYPAHEVIETEVIENEVIKVIPQPAPIRERIGL
jgi:hypothetical protein